MFDQGRVTAFRFKVDTMAIDLGGYVTITARDFTLDTGASDTQELVSFAAVGAKVKIGSLELTGEARNFAFLGNGHFKTKPGFGVFIGVGSATGDSFAWPKFLPIKIDAIGVQWDDVENHPEDFILTLSASVTGLQGAPGLQFSGSVVGIKIKPSLLAQGKFPVIDIQSIGVTVKGDLFGGEIDAGLVGGILSLDSSVPHHRHVRHDDAGVQAGVLARHPAAASRWPAWRASPSASASPSSDRCRPSSTCRRPRASCSCRRSA